MRKIIISSKHDLDSLSRMKMVKIRDFQSARHSKTFFQYCFQVLQLTFVPETHRDVTALLRILSIISEDVYTLLACA